MSTDGPMEPEDFALLRDVGALLSGSSPGRQTLARMCRKLQGRFGGSGSFVAFVDRSGTIRMQCLLEDGELVHVRDPIGPPQTNTSRVATTGKPLLLRTVDDWILGPWTPVVQEIDLGRSASALFVPVIDNGRTIAVISLQARADHLYDEHTLRVVETVARYLAVALRHDRSTRTPLAIVRPLVMLAIVSAALSTTGFLLTGVPLLLATIVWFTIAVAIILVDRASKFRRTVVAFAIEAAASEREQARRESVEEQVRKHAFHDPLTGLPNRAFAFDLLEGSLTRARVSESAFALLTVDLDGFSTLNEALGHRGGDALLVAVARRLERTLQANDVVARLAADQFVVVLKSTGLTEHAEAVAERIARELRTDLSVAGSEVSATASIGIAISNRSDYASPGEMFRDAEIALDAAKAQGGGTFVVFDPAIQGVTNLERTLGREMRTAIANGEMRAFYQPIVDMTSREAVGWEALIRWEHPERGLLLPGQFIPIAERTKAILEIGSWMIETAAAMWASCRPITPAGRPRYVTINISSRHLIEPDFLRRMHETLERHTIPAGALKIELTESLLLERPELASATLAALAEAGVASMIDDFGTGYSSLSYLRRLPLETLKIDQSFVNDLGERPEAIEIVRTIVNLATTLRLGVTAEGIETEEQFAILFGLGVRTGQGYLFARPAADAIIDATRAIAV